MAPVARSETRPGGPCPPGDWRAPGSPREATRHSIAYLATDSTPFAPLIARVALGAVMLPHGAQGSWEGSAVYLAKELRDTRIRVNAADPGYTATDFNVVRAGEVADFKSGAPVEMVAPVTAPALRQRLWEILDLITGSFRSPARPQIILFTNLSSDALVNGV
jgi:hypothetical protein